MVNLSDLSAVHGSEASAKRLKSRKAAEFRLRLYGILAILLSAFALVGLLYSVVGKASGALTETYLKLPVTLPADRIDPKGTGDPDLIGKADFGGMTKAVLRDLFPTVKERKAKKQLYDLVSSGSSFELRQKALEDPSLVGSSFEFDFLASDIVDLYLKGSYGELEGIDHSGSLSLVRDGKTIEVTSSSPDFSEALESVKASLVGRAEHLRRQAALQDNGVRVFQERLNASSIEDERKKFQAEVTSRTALRDKLIADAEELDARSTAPGGREKLEKGDQSILLRVGSGWVKITELTPTGGTGIALMDVGEGTEFATSDWGMYITEEPEQARKISDRQVVWVEQLRDQDRVETRFNWRFFSSGDSREPELAGIWSATVGSFWTMLVTFLLAFPIGVLTAIYLEEFAPRNRITDVIEVNINNLAAVPSIIFGLLGLSVIIGFFGVPRSAPLAGGFVLALMTLPTIIIAARASIAAVPPSIREAAYGVGASNLQVAFHHVLPLSMPGILTGTIIGMARALGETAPLIMIGMVAFIVDVPEGITDSASVLPVQVFRWADFPERAFEARTAAAICVLLAFLIAMNALAVFLRKRFERRW